MARNTLFTVSNPIPSSLRRQNLSYGILISSSFAASHNSSIDQTCVHCSWSQSVPSLLSFSIVRSFMCLSVFQCMSIACSNSLMHTLWLLPFVLGILHFEYGQLFPLAALLSSCFRSLHVPFYTMCTLLFPYSHTSPAVARTGMCQSLPVATFFSVAMVWTCF